MDAQRPALSILAGGRPASAPDRRSRACLRAIESVEVAELEDALAEAVETARLMRLEIERRIARALGASEDQG